MRSFRIDHENFASCGECNYECLKQGAVCQNLTHTQLEIMDAVTQADLVYFIVANYCGYPCANYFAFNERSVGYFNMDHALMEKYMAVRKRFIIVSNFEENFAEAMQQQAYTEPEIPYLKTRKYQKQEHRWRSDDQRCSKSRSAGIFDRGWFLLMILYHKPTPNATKFLFCCVHLAQNKIGQRVTQVNRCAASSARAFKVHRITAVKALYISARLWISNLANQVG